MVEFLTITPQTLPTITKGNDYTTTATITKDGATYVLGACDTVTISVHDRCHPQTGLINDVCIGAACRTCACGILTIKFTDVQTGTLRAPAEQWKSRLHIADVKVVESGCGCPVAHSEPFFIPVRRSVT